MKRNLKRIVAIVLTLSMLSGCAPTEKETTSVSETKEVTSTVATTAVADEETVYTAGTYTAIEKGHVGDVAVTVVLSGDRIESVEVGENNETEGIGSLAIEKIPNAIVERQTLCVDAVSGATETSNAILAAVENCILQAGGDVELLKVKDQAAVEKKTETLECDAVVVGSGLSGLSMAVAALEAGKNVIVLEKLAFTGGSARSSLGTFMIAQTEENKEHHILEGVDDTLDDAVQRWKDYMLVGQEGSVYPDYDKVSNMLVETMPTITWLKSLGCTFFQRYTIEQNGQLAVTVDVPGDTNDKGGAKVMNLLNEKTIELGGKIMTETPAYELIMDRDKVIGVRAESETTKYEIMADDVVLACGGFGSNPEKVAELVPDIYNAGYYCMGVASNTGDGIQMAVDAGADTFEDYWVMPSYISPSVELLQYNPMFYKLMEANGLEDPDSSYDRLLVDQAGNRIMNEAESYSLQNLHMVNAANGPYYVLYDGVEPEIAEILETGLEIGEVIKGETLEELAANAGMKAEALQATVDRYSELAANGKDEDFGKPAERMKPIAEEGPYYLVHFVCCCGASLGGVKTNLDNQVIRADGSVIEGLWAVGEMSNRDYYSRIYFSGSSLTFSCSMGRLVGTKIGEK